MEADILIEKMTDKDLGKVGDLFFDVFNAAGESWSKEAALAHVQQNFFGDLHWVARKNGEIIGFLMGIVLTREDGPELFIDSVAVATAMQKQGIGEALWHVAEAYAKESKLHGVRFLANPSLPSYAWYETMGFKKSGWVELFRKI